MLKDSIVHGGNLCVSLFKATDSTRIGVSFEPRRVRLNDVECGPQIRFVHDDGLACAAGLRTGDFILALNGSQLVSSWICYLFYIRTSPEWREL